jgi:hypothetical protein
MALASVLAEEPHKKPDSAHNSNSDPENVEKADTVKKVNAEKTDPRLSALQEKADKFEKSKLGKYNPSHSGTVLTASAPEKDSVPSDVYIVQVNQGLKQNEKVAGSHGRDRYQPEVYLH